MIAFASSLDQAGPLTRDVADSALLLRHLAGADPCDMTSVGLREEIALPTAERLDGVRLGVPEELSGDGIDPGVRESFERSLQLAEELGASVEPCQLPHAPHALSAYYMIAPAECSSNLARFDGVRYGLRVEADDAAGHVHAHPRTPGFGPEVKRRIMLGTYALSSGYYDAYYGRAQQVRTMIAEDFARGLRAVRLHRHPDRAERRLRARREDRRPAGDVPQRLLHRPDVARRHPGDLDPERAERRAARRPAARRPGVQREPRCSTRRTRSRQRSASSGLTSRG